VHGNVQRPQQPKYDATKKRKRKFLHNIMSSANVLCEMCGDCAQQELMDSDDLL